MASSSQSRPQTPAHHPVHDIHLTHAEIETIVQQYNAKLRLASVQELPSSRSWNNRIYFLTVRIRYGQNQELALKVNGRFFGPQKVENEVACLQLLKSHCPSIPVPRVLAWAAGGETMLADSVYKPSQPSHDGHSNCWILMTKLRGTPISVIQPNERTMVRLAKELAFHVATWRHDVPKMKECGTIRFLTDEHLGATRPFTTHEIAHNKLVIRGIVGENIEARWAVESLSHYYRTKLREKLRHLETLTLYPASKDSAARIKNFIVEGLERLSLTQKVAADENSEGEFVFTHYDLSPRNILISKRSHFIVGILDFEFSGFFSPMEEFVNDHVNNEDDWPQPAYEAYLKKLEEYGEATPIEGLNKLHWQQAVWLETLVQNINPWWLPGKYEGAELAVELEKARKTVNKMLDNLEKNSLVDTKPIEQASEEQDILDEDE